MINSNGSVKMTLLDRIKVAIAFIMDVFATSELSDGERDARKLDRGIEFPNETFVVWKKDGKLKFGRAIAEMIKHLSNRFINGLVGQLVDGQIFVDVEGIMPPATAENGRKFRNMEDAERFRKDAKMGFARILYKIEEKLKIWVLPMAKGSEFIWRGKEYRKLYFLKRITGECRNDALVRSMASRLFDNHNPIEAMITKIVKSLEYLGTAILGIPFARKVFVVPQDWAIEPKSMDGCAFHLVPKNNAVLLRHPRQGFDITLSSVLHLRGLGHGIIFKGTSVPVTYNMVRRHFKSECHHVVVKALEASYHVCTSDVMKDATPGRYHGMRFFWHNDSSQISFWQDVKLCFAQWSMMRIFKHTDGLEKCIEERVKRMGAAIGHTRTMVEYIVGEAKNFNDENVPVLGIVEGLVQILNGRPFGLSISDQYNVKKPMRSLLKALTEVRIGTRDMRHWSLKDHNGIGARAFIVGDPTLRRGEFGVPFFMARKLVELGLGHFVSLNGETCSPHHARETRAKFVIDDVYAVEARRHPQTITSSLPVMLIIRHDDFAYFTVPTADMNNYGADFDGDKMEVVIHAKSMYEIEDTRQCVVDTWTHPKLDVTKLAPYADAMIPEEMIGYWHFNSLFERLMADPIGLVSHYIEIIGHWLNKSVDDYPSLKEVFAVQNYLQVGPLCRIIDGKKHNVEEAVCLPGISHIINKLRLRRPGKGWAFFNGKLDFAQARRIMVNNFAQSVPLEDIPRFIKDEVAKTEGYERYPIARVFFNSILKYFPDKMEGTSLDTNEVDPRGVLGDIILNLHNDWYDVIGKKMGFRMSGVGTINHIELDKYFNQMMVKSRNKDNDYQDWRRTEHDRIWDMLFKSIASSEDKAVAELWIMAYAFAERCNGMAWSKHCWLMSRVSGPSFIKFIQLLYGLDDAHEKQEDMGDEFDADIAKRILGQ